MIEGTDPVPQDPPSAPNDDLQDLSSEDAGELRAFLEKRRWFEGKLKELEAVQPIYPFLHPVLTASSSNSKGFEYEVSASSSFRLPSEADIIQWQEERDTVEEEVMAFDGGDLARMKEKTRQVTLVPLTEPSTDLVAITLDLILLIDRLLISLRHRSDLLELVALRLEWDSLRWKVMRECEEVKQEISTFVAEEAIWQPTVMRLESQKRSLKNNGNTPETGNEPSLDGCSGRRKRESTVEPTTPPTQSPASFTSLTHSRANSLLSPTYLTSPAAPLHPLTSTLNHLQRRQRSISTSELKRSSSILDRMIDLAGPLKGLGGLDGPLEVHESTAGGALPDELLDLQDDLDADVGEVKERIAWCKTFRTHWDKCEAHYASSSRAKQGAQSTAQALRSALQQPATSTQHAAMSKMLLDAEAALPTPIDKSFPNPTHADYPEATTHTAETKSALERYRKEACEECERTKFGVQWYGQVAASRAEVERYDKELVSMTGALKDLHKDLMLDPEAFNLDTNERSRTLQNWYQTAPAKLVDIESATNTSLELVQQSSIAHKRYEVLVANPSMQLKHVVGDVAFPDDLHATVNNNSKALFDVMRESAGIKRRGEEDLELSGAVLRLSSILGGRGDESYTKLASDLASAVEQAVWTNAATGHQDLSQVDSLRESAGNLQSQAAEAIKADSELQAIITRFERNPAHFNPLKTRLESRQTQSNGLVNLATTLTSVRTQTNAIRTIDEEALHLLDRLGAAIPGESDVRLDDDVNDVAALETQVTLWSSSLSQRVPFLTGGSIEGETATAHLHARDSPIDLGVVDQAVRQHVNELSARIASAIFAKKEFLRATHDALENATGVLPMSLSHEPKSCREGAADDMEMNGNETPNNSTNHAKMDEDVFGVIASNSRPSLGTPTHRATPPPVRSDPISMMRHLRRRIKYLHIPDHAFPSDSAIRRTPSFRSVPTAEAVARFTKELLDIESRADEVVSTNESVDGVSSQFTKFRDELASAQAFLPRLESLAGFGAAVRDADEALGKLMSHIDDESCANGVERLSHTTAVKDAESAVRTAESFAQTVETDRRVVVEVKRLRSVWLDVSASLGGATGSGRQSIMPRSSVAAMSEADQDSRSEADTASISSTQISGGLLAKANAVRIGTNQAQSSQASLGVDFRKASSLRTLGRGIPHGAVAADSVDGNTNRSTSNPFPRLAKTTESVRNRTLSGYLPPVSGRTRQDSTVSATSRVNAALHDSSSDVRRGSTPNVGIGTSKIPRAVFLALRNVSSPHSTPSMREQSGRVPSYSKAPGIKTTDDVRDYVSDPKSSLDQAVGKIVNQLKMNVPVIPVNINGSDDWKDQSGRYWIGAHGRAKLCFCRILKSRTVMVRVGGGWVELSKFLMDHFAETIEQMTFEDPASTTSATLASIGPIVINSASLAAQKPNQGGAASQTTAAIQKAALPSGSASPTHPASAANTTETTDSIAAPALPSTANGPVTPIRKSGIAPSSPFSPSQSHHSAMSGGNVSRSSSFGLLSVGPPGAGSPLVPQHFMRKASESPPVREREKEKLGLGRRSILGKEG